MTKRDEGTEPGAQHCPTGSLFCRLPAIDVRKMEMMLPTILVQSTIRKNLHKHAHSMATGQTGRNRAQMHCTTGSGILTSEQKKDSIPVAFHRSTEMQTAGV